MFDAGSLQKMVLELMPCPDHALKSCLGNGSWLLRRHGVEESEATFFEECFEEEQGVELDCIHGNLTVACVRDELDVCHRLPPLYFRWVTVSRHDTGEPFNSALTKQIRAT